MDFEELFLKQNEKKEKKELPLFKEYAINFDTLEPLRNGNNLVELNVIQNGFEDTSINVIFLVIDKEKSSPEFPTIVKKFKAAVNLRFRGRRK